MRTVGVRQLRQRASEYLRRVEGGTTFQVTARGRAVALLVPVRPAGRRARLIAQGRIVPGAGDALDLGAPVPPARGVSPASERLRRARAAER